MGDFSCTRVFAIVNRLSKDRWLSLSSGKLWLWDDETFEKSKVIDYIGTKRESGIINSVYCRRNILCLFWTNEFFMNPANLNLEDRALPAIVYLLSVPKIPSSNSESRFRTSEQYLAFLWPNLSFFFSWVRWCRCVSKTTLKIKICGRSHKI